MADENQNERVVVPPAILEEVQEPIIEPAEGDGTPHPLAPGGRRFEQVYAQNKQTQRELADERDKRIRLEAQLELLSKRPTEQQEQVLTWDQLEPMIASGQITRAQAQDHREKVLRQSITQEVTSAHQRTTSASSKEQTLNQEINAYLQAAPNLENAADPKRVQLDQEFDYQCELQGLDARQLTPLQRKTVEITALRTVFGPRESLTKRMTPMNETQQGIPGGQPRNTNVNPDQALLNALSPREVAHYNRGIKRGTYKSWKDVVAELKFARP